MGKIKIGIIGGTGLDEPNILKNPVAKEVHTRYGAPSDRLIAGQIHGVDVVLLARHGRNHTIHPSQVNYRANLWALKEEGCTHVVVTNAVGSLQEHIAPGDIVIMDQFVDRTTKREQTFYDGTVKSPPGICHIPMAYPFDQETRQILIGVADELKVKYHPTGTITVIEGPRYSTKAESLLFRSWNCDIIGMTSVPEVVLANELGLAYAAIGLVTDTDCWKDGEHVTADLVVQRFKEFATLVVEILSRSIEKMKDYDWGPMIARREKMLVDAIMVPKERTHSAAAAADSNPKGGSGDSARTVSPTGAPAQLVERDLP
ncbi:S-methyl-5'-thioadenosine phosphorylase [Hypsibius exemplaris]|uniref:S-methyl-5'-thioadenosine phosphorylase n=1 Tax=Hypsibius exemplaris TaxID=2072580 RepID=A0A1W0WAQ8_HYPEX|nr:S-methyl-5'-thioadenosine phosphorylase [Hypsibius exemplaris]